MMLAKRERESEQENVQDTIFNRRQRQQLTHNLGRESKLTTKYKTTIHKSMSYCCILKTANEH